MSFLINSYRFGVTEYPTGAAVAFGLRELPGYSWTGALVRVRRASDNSESDFYQGATAGTLNTTRGGGGTSLESWAGGNSYVKTYYDQSGNTNNATQTTAAIQNQITDGASNIILSNGKASTLSYVGNEYVLNTSLGSSEPYTFVIVAERDDVFQSSPRIMVVAGRGPNGYRSITHYEDNYYYMQSQSGEFKSNTTYNNYNQQIIIGTMNGSGSNRILESNNSSIAGTFTSGVVATNFNLVFGLSDFGNGSKAHIQEFLFWASDKSASNSDIRNTANAYYSAF